MSLEESGLVSQVQNHTHIGCHAVATLLQKHLGKNEQHGGAIITPPRASEVNPFLLTV